jgi:hypothetical protein
VRSRNWLWMTLIVASLGMLLAWAPFQSLGPALSEDLYGDRALYGVCATALGVGSLSGAFLAMRWRPEQPMFLAMLMNLWWASNYLIFGTGAPLPIVLVSFALAGVTIALFVIWWETTLTLNVPPHALSRVSAFDWMASLGLSPIGLIAAGPIAARIGAQETLIGGAALALAVSVVGVFVIRRHPLKSGTPLSGVEASA